MTYKYPIGKRLRIINEDSAFYNKTFVVEKDGRRMSGGIKSVPTYYYYNRWLFEGEVEEVDDWGTLIDEQDALIELLAKALRDEWVTCKLEEKAQGRKVPEDHLLPWSELDDRNKAIDRRLALAVVNAYKRSPEMLFIYKLLPILRSMKNSTEK